MYRARLDNDTIDNLIDTIRAQLSRQKLVNGAISFSANPAEIKDAPKAKLVFEKEAYSKAMALVEECSKEIAWHCLIQKESNGKFVTYKVTDVIVFPQTVTGATVVSDAAEYTEWVMELSDEVFNNMRGHMHSHVNMGTSPSGVDTQYQEEVTENLDDFYVFMIWNKKGSHWEKIVDIEDNIVYECKDIELYLPVDDYSEWAEDMIMEYVKDSKPTAKSKTYTYADWQKEQLDRINAEKESPADDDDYDEDGFSYNREWWNQFR